MTQIPLSALPAATTNLSSTDTLVGVTSGPKDVRFSPAQVAKLKLTGNTTFYVSTTGSDSNPGTVSLPFRHIQFAINYVSNNVDAMGFLPTIQVADGTYNEEITLFPVFGCGVDASELVTTAFLTGNHANPKNVVIKPTVSVNLTVVFAFGSQTWIVDGFSFSNVGNTSQNLVNAENTATIILGNVDFNISDNTFNMLAILESTFNAAVYFLFNSQVTVTGNNNNITSFVLTAFNGFFQASITLTISGTITWSGTPFFGSPAFALAAEGGICDFTSTTFNVTGSVNGDRVSGINGGTIITNNTGTGSQGLAFLPGTSFGTLDRTSIYDNQLFAEQKAGLPATTDLLAGAWGMFKDTSGGGVYMAYNDAGTIKKVALV